MSEEIRLDEKYPLIHWMEQKYPKTLEELIRLQVEELNLIFSKQADYGPTALRAGTLLETDEDRNFALLGIMIRMQDKVSRILNLLKKKENPKHESIDDSLKDISNYANLGLCIINKVWGK